MKQVTLYTKPDCPLCEDAKQLLKIVQQHVPFELQEVDIYQDDALLETYQLMIPVVHMDGEDIAYGQIDLDHVWKVIEG